jgi:hypothetical protein
MEIRGKKFFSSYNFLSPEHFNPFIVMLRFLLTPCLYSAELQTARAITIVMVVPNICGVLNMEPASCRPSGV